MLTVISGPRMKPTLATANVMERWNARSSFLAAEATYDRTGAIIPVLWIDGLYIYLCMHLTFTFLQTSSTSNHKSAYQEQSVTRLFRKNREC